MHFWYSHLIVDISQDSRQESSKLGNRPPHSQKHPSLPHHVILRCSCCVWSVVVVFLILSLMLFLVHCCFVDIVFTLSLLLLIHCCPYLPSFTPFSSTTLMSQLNPHIFQTQNIPCVGEKESWDSLFSRRTIRIAVILGHSWAGSEGLRLSLAPDYLCFLGLYSSFLQRSAHTCVNCLLISFFFGILSCAFFSVKQAGGCDRSWILKHILSTLLYVYVHI